MLTRHWVMIAVMLILGYVAGIYFPGPGKSALSKIGA